MTLQRMVGTASRALTHCCGPGTANRPYWMCNGYLPSRASRKTVVNLCASVSRPCPSRTTSKRGATQSSKANQLFLQRYWLASLEVDQSSCGSFFWSYSLTSPVNLSSAGPGTDGSSSLLTPMRWPAGGGRGKINQR